MPRNIILPPAPARYFSTNGIDEEILQTFPASTFVMPQANGRYIAYDGATDPKTVDIRFSVEQAHNYPRFQVGASKLEALLKHGDDCEIEIDLYNGGTALTNQVLKIGAVYGATLQAANTGPNKTAKPVWYMDATKTTDALTFLRIKATDLRGYGSTGVMGDSATGTAGTGDLSARVLAIIYR